MMKNKNNKEDIDLIGTLKGSDTVAKFQDEWLNPSELFVLALRRTIKHSNGLVKDEG